MPPCKNVPSVEGARKTYFLLLVTMLLYSAETSAGLSLAMDGSVLKFAQREYGRINIGDTISLKSGSRGSTHESVSGNRTASGSAVANERGRFQDILLMWL